MSVNPYSSVYLNAVDQALRDSMAKRHPVVVPNITRNGDTLTFTTAGNTPEGRDAARVAQDALFSGVTFTACLRDSVYLDCTFTARPLSEITQIDACAILAVSLCADDRPQFVLDHLAYIRRELPSLYSFFVEHLNHPGCLDWLKERLDPSAFGFDRSVRIALPALLQRLSSGEEETDVIDLLEATLPVYFKRQDWDGPLARESLKLCLDYLHYPVVRSAFETYKESTADEQLRGCLETLLGEREEYIDFYVQHAKRHLEKHYGERITVEIVDRHLLIRYKQAEEHLREPFHQGLVYPNPIFQLSRTKESDFSDRLDLLFWQPHNWGNPLQELARESDNPIQFLRDHKPYLIFAPKETREYISEQFGETDDGQEILSWLEV